MRKIQLNKRTARLLRDNLTANAEGYDYTDLCRLDHLAKKLTELQGEYASQIAELAREERRQRRVLARNPEQAEVSQRVLARISWDAEDLHEAAEQEPVELTVEEADWKLIGDKIGNVNRWSAVDGIRHLVIGMVEAVRNAESDEPNDDKVKSIRR